MQSPWPGQDVLVNGQVTNVGADGLFRVFLTDREVVRITGAKRVERERESLMGGAGFIFGMLCDKCDCAM